MIDREPAATTPTEPEEAVEEAPAEAQVLRSRADVGQAPRALPAGAGPVRAGRARRALRPADLAAPAGPDQRADPDHPHPEQRRHERRAGLRGSARHGIRAAGEVEAHNPAPAGAASACPMGVAPDWASRGVRAAPRAGGDDLDRRARQPEGATDPGDPAPYPRATRRLLARVPGRHDRARGARLADRHRRHRQEDRLGPAAVLVRDAAHAGRPARRAGRAPGRAHRTQGLAPTTRTISSSACSSRTRCTRPTST